VKYTEQLDHLLAIIRSAGFVESRADAYPVRVGLAILEKSAHLRVVPAVALRHLQKLDAFEVSIGWVLRAYSSAIGQIRNELRLEGTKSAARLHSSAPSNTLWYALQDLPGWTAGLFPDLLDGQSVADQLTALSAAVELLNRAADNETVCLQTILAGRPPFAMSHTSPVDLAIAAFILARVTGQNLESVEGQLAPIGNAFSATCALVAGNHGASLSHLRSMVTALRVDVLQ
jgi:hypothetical protein